MVLPVIYGNFTSKEISLNFGTYLFEPLSKNW
jgi:hypothetical protein